MANEIFMVDEEWLIFDGCVRVGMGEMGDGRG